MVKIVSWVLVSIHMTVIFYLSSISQFPKAVPDWVFYFDKVVHFIVFGVLGLLFLNAWLGGQWRCVDLTSVMVSVTFTMLYGISDEIHQMFVPGRTPSIGDIIADTTGALVLCLMFYWIFKPKVQEEAA
jgi:VanZ family protein